MEGATPSFIADWAKAFNFTQKGNILEHPMNDFDDGDDLNVSDLNYSIAINAKPLNFVTSRVFQFTILDITDVNFSLGLVTSSYDKLSRPGLIESSFGITFEELTFYANGKPQQTLSTGFETILSPGDKLGIIARFTDDFKVT